ncbi:hypothetical protein DL763_004579 [Monosporascus cannonballus]|nr:hypothetical protein DL763_004579 [Monosporascus cannonballus]
MDNLFEQIEVCHHSSGESLLYILAERNLARLIKAHFTTSSPLETSPERYENPFFAALATGSTDAVRAFAELELQSMKLSTPFQRLCQSFLENADQIPKPGPHFCPSKDLNWLKLAKRGEVEIARLLLAMGEMDLVDVKDTDGRTPLWWAAKNGHEAVAKLLLDTGKVDPDVKDNHGQTPLLSATEREYEAVVKLLLDTGKVHPDVKDKDGWTPLSLAVRKGYEVVVKLLLGTGKVDPDSKTTLRYYIGRTPLSIAAQKGREGIVKLLLDTGNVNGGSMGTDGRTPLSWAAENGQEAIVKLLLDIGKVDIDLEDEYGRTPLWYAAEKAREPIVRLLSMQSPANPQIQLEDVGATKKVEVERKQSLRTDDDPLNIEAVQPGLPTDSGYASATHDKYGHTQSTGNVQFQPPIDEVHASTINNTFEIPYNERDRESDDVGTVYLDASSLPALAAEESYISESADGLFKRLATGFGRFSVKLSKTSRICILMRVVTLLEDRIGVSDNMTLNEVMGLRDKNLEDPEDDVINENRAFSRIDAVLPNGIHDASVDELMNQDFNEGDEKGNQDASTPQLCAYRDFIFNSPAYEWLLASLCKKILLAPAEPNSLEAIRREIIKSLPSSHIVSRNKPAEAYRMTFFVEWNPLAFVVEQGYEEEPDEAIGIAVTLTGSATDAQALASAQYLCQTWPTVGEHIIRLVREVVRSGTGHRHKCDLPDNTNLIAWVHGSKFVVEVFGTKDSVAEIGEQLAWLGATDANYAIESSRLSRPHEGCALEKVLLYGGQIITGGFPFSISQKDTPVRISRSGYTLKLKWIHENALLHLLRASLEYDSIDEFNYEFRFKREEMQETPETHKPNSVVKVLLNRENMELEIYPEKEDYVRVRNRVEDLLDTLEKIIDYQFLATSQSGVNLKFRARKYLEGWDFNDLAKPSDPIHPRHPEEEILLSPSKQSEIQLYDSGIGSSLSSSAAEGRGDFADSSSLPPSERSSSETLTRKHYEVGVVCALPKELMAVRVLFDSKHEVPKTPPEDDNSYSLGRIGEHNVVATCLLEYGTNAATAAVVHMIRSFPVRFCLLVGIGGRVPSKQPDIRLGDVVVSNTGVIQYDLVKRRQGGVPERTGCLPPPPPFLTKTISSLRSDPNISTEPLRKYVEDIATRKQEYKDPGPEHDKLFEAEYVHDRNHESCEQCHAHKIKRKSRPENHPTVHYGSIASGNQVMKDAQIRDKLGAQDRVLCFEMEAAGIMKIVPCVVIRGICDYADSHKNKLWQEYAATTAAAYAKFFLSFVRNSNDLESMPTNSETVKSNHSRKRPAESLQLRVSSQPKKSRQGRRALCCSETRHAVT